MCFHNFLFHFYRDDGEWYFQSGRLEISYMPFSWSRWILKGGRAPGVWTASYGPFFFNWWRRWIVWEDHPFRSENIRLYDQFGTYAAKEETER